MEFDRSNKNMTYVIMGKFATAKIKCSFRMRKYTPMVVTFILMRTPVVSAGTSRRGQGGGKVDCLPPLPVHERVSRTVVPV